MCVRWMAIPIVLFLSIPLCGQWSNVRPGSGGGDLREGTPVPSPVMDALGDAIAVFSAGPPLLDIEMVHVTYDNDSLHFQLEFFTPIAPASAAADNSLSGLLELDVDQNVATGFPALQTNFSPPFAALDLGTDYFVDLFSDAMHPGFLDVFVVNPATGPELIGTVPVVLTTTA